MRLVTLTAENPAAALAQIQAQLGPEAVVLSVRPCPASGLARLWQKSGAVEVLAGVAEDEAPKPGEQYREAARRQAPLPSLYSTPSRPHVFIGPPGVGKTTLLCKWLTNAVLSEQRTVRVWRLDGANANAAELLNVYAEMFGLGVARFWSPQSTELTGESLLLVDLPGVETGDPHALAALRNQLAALPNPRLHLVLNAAYQTTILSEQIRAFASFQPEDLSFTHLDEANRSDAAISLAAGMNCSVRFLSGGQKIPGECVTMGSSPPSRTTVPIENRPLFRPASHPANNGRGSAKPERAK